MNPCIFCGSPAVRWADIAPESVRVYRLCEYHMNQLLSYEGVKVYNKDRVKRAVQFNQIRERIIAACYDYNSKGEPQSHSDYEYEDQFYELIPDEMTFGPPEGIDEHRVSEWICEKIKYFARRNNNDMPVVRCSGFIETRPDSRCTNYSSSELCLQCEKSNARKLRLELAGLKILKAVEILKDHHQ